MYKQCYFISFNNFRDTTLPRSSERKNKSEDKIENEGEGKSENDAFARKYCAEVSINLLILLAYLLFSYSLIKYLNERNKDKRHFRF
jgi:hypothetical protein